MVGGLGAQRRHHVCLRIAVSPEDRRAHPITNLRRAVGAAWQSTSKAKGQGSGSRQQPNQAAQAGPAAASSRGSPGRPTPRRVAGIGYHSVDRPRCHANRDSA
jgi:hypothetical protein